MKGQVHALLEWRHGWMERDGMGGLAWMEGWPGMDGRKGAARVARHGWKERDSTGGLAWMEGKGQSLSRNPSGYIIS